MKLLVKNYKKGEVVLIIDQELDLWNLSQIILPGDIIYGSTYRKIEIDRGGEKREVIKKRIYVGIEVESIKWKEKELEVLGKIVEAPEEIGTGKYQNIHIKIGDKIKIIKESWDSFKEELENASKEREFSLLVIVFDRDEATFGKVDNKGYKIFSNIQIEKLPKENEFSEEYKKLATLLKKEYNKGKYDGIIVGCPNLLKDYFLQHVDEDLKKDIIVVNVSYAGEHGIKEIIKSDAIKKAFNRLKAIKEAQIIERIKERLANNMLVYGEQQVEEALKMGAVEMLVVTKNYISRSLEREKKVGELFKLAKDTNAKISILSGSQEVEGLGGVVGILRFRVDY